MSVRSPAAQPKLGLRANAGQFWLLVAVNAFVGSMVGLEREVVPVIGERTFHLASETAIASFIVTFGFTKAFANLYSGRAADRLGRRPLLIAGWLAGVPLPFILMFAPSWSWVVVANVLLGINQGLCWSMTVVMKIDLVGPKLRGFAMGLNEFAGYLSVGLAAYASGVIAQTHGLRPWPFALGVVASVAGLALSLFAVRETLGHARAEADVFGGAESSAAAASQEGFKDLFAHVSWRDPSLSAISQAGLVNNLNDGLVWALVPIYLAAAGLSVERIGVIAAIYPATWGVCQIATGALSDVLGRKWMIAWGMWLQAGAILLFLAQAGFGIWVVAAVLLGVGTALVYPTLLAAIGDFVQPLVRASAVGVYRLWRDSGYAFGALVSGAVADLFGHRAAIAVVAVLTFLSGAIVAVRMQERFVRARGGITAVMGGKSL